MGKKKLPAHLFFTSLLYVIALRHCLLHKIFHTLFAPVLRRWQLTPVWFIEAAIAKNAPERAPKKIP
ncbi:MAG: hypothetical protein LBK18_00160 [Prevotellaceae bacterium]|nr:hypothetical protein [Prevotellaceae bacterium]